MLNIFTDAIFSVEPIDILIYILIAIAFLAAIIYAFITGKLTFAKILKDPLILKKIYDKVMEKFDKKIQRAEKKEEKAIKKEDETKEMKYRHQKEQLELAKCEFEECGFPIAELEKLIEDKEESQDEPKLDKDKEI